MHPAAKCKSSNHPNTRLGTLQGVASSWQAGNLEIEITKVTAKAAFGCIWHRSAFLYICVIELRSAVCLFEKGYKHDEIRLALLNASSLASPHLSWFCSRRHLLRRHVRCWERPSRHLLRAWSTTAWSVWQLSIGRDWRHWQILWRKQFHHLPIDKQQRCGLKWWIQNVRGKW